MSRWAQFWEQFRRNRGAVVGLCIVAIVIAMAIAAPASNIRIGCVSVNANAAPNARCAPGNISGSQMEYSANTPLVKNPATGNRIKNNVSPLAECAA